MSPNPGFASRSQRLVDDAYRASWQVRTGKVALKPAFRILAQASAAARPGLDPQMPEAARVLLEAILEQAEQARPAAAARRLLVRAGAEPTFPPAAHTGLLEYVRHAWLTGHAELTSPKRRVRLAVNRWVRNQQSSTDLHEARALVAEEMPRWEQQLTQAAADIPAALCALDLSSPSRRFCGQIWADSDPRTLLLGSILWDTFPPRSGSRWGHERTPVIASDGGRFTLVLPATWAYWLTGPCRGFQVTQGPTVAAGEVEAHTVALRLWDRGTGPGYAEALDVARDILSPTGR